MNRSPGAAPPEITCSEWMDELEAVLSKLYDLTARAAETKRDDILDDLLAARINVQETVNTERSRSSIETELSHRYRHRARNTCVRFGSSKVKLLAG